MQLGVHVRTVPMRGALRRHFSELVVIYRENEWCPKTRKSAALHQGAWDPNGHCAKGKSVIPEEEGTRKTAIWG